jgi:hypothetical protein
MKEVRESKRGEVTEEEGSRLSPSKEDSRAGWGACGTKRMSGESLWARKTENRTEVTENRTDRFRFLIRFPDLRNRNNLG